MQPIISLDLWPDKATYQPGEGAVIQVMAQHEGTDPLPAHLTIQLVDLTRTIHEYQETISLLPGASHYAVPLALPLATLRGYGVEATITDAQGVSLATASTALDVLRDWTQAPRYGFLADFAPDDGAHATEAVAQLNRYHINLAQFYDWMWRHYALMPPTPTFTEALGRTLSLDVVRAKVTACHAHNIATMGYAAVYGAEPEYADAHPAEVLYDGAGQPHSLEGLFTIMNIHRGNPWRDRILGEMTRAVAEVPFDGLHLDQYGFPTQDVYGPAPERQPYDLAEDFPPFIDDARVAIQQPGPVKRVIFNAVRNWPIDAVAATTQDAIYIEAWPPYETFTDLQGLITHAQSLSAQKQVIIAAYMKPLRTCLPADFDQALAATRLTSATIWANGGFHLLLGETNAALQDAYYPDYVTLPPDAVGVLRSYADFVVRYEAVLSDRRLHAHPVAGNLIVQGMPAVASAEPGRVWCIARSMPGYFTVSLLNLTGAAHARWNEPTASPPPQTDLTLRLHLVDAAPITQVFTASPDDDGHATTLPFTLHKEGDTCWLELTLPRLIYWQLLVIVTAP